MQKGPRAGVRLEVEVALKPDDPFVSEESGVLTVPVAWDLHCGSGCEIVLLVVRPGVDVWMGVECVAVISNLPIEGIQSSSGRLVYKVVPVSVKGDGCAVVDPDKKGS
jgi:hypothetical protein